LKKNKSSKIKKATHEKIERAVLKVFSETDFHKANMRQVAKEAGVSFETIYKYYRNKEGLLFYYIKLWLVKSISGMEEHLQGIEHIRERIRKFTWVQNKFYEQNPEIGTIIFMTVPLKTWMEDASFKHLKMINALIKLIQEGQENENINPNIPPQIIVDIWLGIVTRTFTMWIYKKRHKNITSDFNIRFEIFWNGIAKRPS
jgi:AcrR family transcriptional regulator